MGQRKGGGGAERVRGQGREREGVGQRELGGGVERVMGGAES